GTDRSRGRVGIGLADLRGEADARTVARQRLRHRFVGGAHRSTLGVELRVVLVGLGECSAKRISLRVRRDARRSHNSSHANKTRPNACATRRLHADKTPRYSNATDTKLTGSPPDPYSTKWGQGPIGATPITRGASESSERIQFFARGNMML